MNYITGAPAAVRGSAPAGAFSLVRFWARIRLARQVAAERRSLAAADPAMLRDLGLDRSDVAREAQRPVWDLPAGR